MGREPVISVYDLVTSLHAIYSVPRPTDRLSNTIFFTEVDVDFDKSPIFQSLNPPLSPRPISSPFIALSKEIFDSTEFKTITNHALRTMKMTHVFPGNRRLLVSVPENSTQPERSLLRIREPSLFLVRKNECMYRTNWNKKKPFGVGNPIYISDYDDPLAFSEHILGGRYLSPESSVVNILSDLRHRCLSFDFERIDLGLICPLALMGTQSPLEVLKKLPVVPALSVSSDRVTFMISSVLSRLLPPSLLGHGGLVWRSKVFEYISTCNRFEAVQTDSIRVGLTKRLRTEIPDACKRKEIECRIILFVFRRVIIPLISYLFYVTETDTGDCAYFRRPVWDVLVTKASLGLVELLRLQPGTGTSGSSVRWIPKTSGGLRPVVRQPKHIKERTRRLLRYLKAVSCRFPDRLGFSVFSRDALQQKLVALLGKGESLKGVNVVCADIQNCFESIPLEGLENALKYFCADHQTFASIMIQSTTTGSGICRRQPFVFFQNDWMNLIDQLPRNSLVEATGSPSVERMNYGQVRTEILKIVRSGSYMLTTTGSTTSKDLFTVTTHGLPQGSSFSGMLVAIYYGFVDRMRPNPTSVACTLRLVDDMLCLTKDKALSDNLFAALVKNREYGPINEAKIMNTVVSSAGTEFEWAGFRIQPEGFFFNVSLQDKDVVASRNGTHRSKGSLADYLKHTLGRAVAQYCLPILFNSKLNSKNRISDNAYRAGVLTANRLAYFLKHTSLKEEEGEVFRILRRLEIIVAKKFIGKNHRLLIFFKSGLEHTLRRSLDVWSLPALRREKLEVV